MILTVARITHRGTNGNNCDSATLGSWGCHLSEIHRWSVGRQPVDWWEADDKMHWLCHTVLDASRPQEPSTISVPGVPPQTRTGCVRPHEAGSCRLCVPVFICQCFDLSPLWFVAVLTIPGYQHLMVVAAKVPVSCHTVNLSVVTRKYRKSNGDNRYYTCWFITVKH